METVDQETILNIFDFNYQKFYSLFSNSIQNSEFNITTYLISWNLSKLSEIHPEFYSRNKLHFIIQDFLSLINESENQELKTTSCFYKVNTQIFMINLLINCVNYHGDKKTQKTNSFFSPYNKIVIDFIFKKLNLIFSLIVIKNISEKIINSLLNLAINYFRLLNKIIEFSADDFQEVIEEILIYLVNIKEEVDNKIIESEISEDENKNLGNYTFSLKKSQILINYRDHLIMVINVIFGKINRIVKEDLITRILTSIINSYKMNEVNSLNSLNCLSYVVLSIFAFYAFYKDKNLIFTLSFLKILDLKEKITPFLYTLANFLNDNLKNIFSKIYRKIGNNDDDNLQNTNSFDIFMNYSSSISCYRNICIIFENCKTL